MANLFDQACKVINIYDGPKVFLQTFASVDPATGLFYAAHFAQSEICNGGFKQFFSNSTGVLAPEALRGFEAIGMPQTAAVMQTAMSFFAEPYPRKREARQQQLKAVDQISLSGLHTKFYAVIESENGGFEIAASAFLPNR